MRGKSLNILFFLLMLLGVGSPAFASYFPSATSNVGIGTTQPVYGKLVVANGNLGVGSFAPGKALDVTGTVRADYFIGDGSQLTGVSSISGLTTNYVPKATSATGIGNSSIIDNGVNVGIGTAVPGAGLDVSGNIRALGGRLYFGANDYLRDNGTTYELYGNNTLVFTVDGSGTAVGGNYDSGYQLKVIDLNASRVGFGIKAASSQTADLQQWLNSSGAALDVVNASGNVGIGTINPVSKLSVAGNIGIGTHTNSSYMTTAPPLGGLIVEGNVGIGSLTPGTKLDVVGTVRATGFIGDGSGLTGISGAISGLNAGYLSKSATATSINDSAIYQSGSNIGIGTTTPSGGLIVMNGNVGIGTWLPTAVLSVYALGGNAHKIQFMTGASDQNISDYYSTEANPRWQIGPSIINGNASGIVFGIGNATTMAAGGVAIGIPNTQRNMVFQTSNGTNLTERMRIDGNGNIGINTLTAVSTLNINGGVGIGTTTTNSAYLAYNSAPAGGLIVQNNVGIGTFNPFGGNLIVNGGGNVGINTLSPGTALDIIGTVRAISFIGDGSGLTGLTSSQWATQNTTDVSLAGGNVGIGTTKTATSALSVMNGNVGIGTWKPDAYFQVAPYASGTSGFLVDRNGNVGMGTTTTTAAGLAIMNGNVGIGTWNPSQSLEVNTPVSSNFGGVRVYGSSNGNNGNIGFQITGALYGDARQYSITAYRGGGYGIGLFYGTTTGGSQNTSLSPVWFANSNNNMGIGTASPGSTFSVFGGAAIGSHIYAVNNAAPINGMIVEGNVGIGTFSPFGGNLIINGGGNVGIGTLVPGTVLDVIGTVRATGFTGDGSGLTNVSAANWTASGSNVYESAGNVGIGTNKLTTSALTVMNGNVGIGTWKPAYLLDTNGSFHANDATVTNNLAVSTGQLTVSSGNIYLADGSRISWPGGALLSNGNGSSNSTLQILNYDGGHFLYAQESGDEVTLGSTNQFTLVNNNIGLGTTNPVAGLVVMNGNVGIGTWKVDSGSFIVAASAGNVGIGTIRPGKALDVIGTVRANYFVGDGSGLTGISSSQWATQNSTDVSLAGGNVGIGTTKTTTSALTVMNGSVGIGTWKPAYLLDVNGAENLNGALNINYTASSGPSLSVVGGGNGDNLVTITRTVGGDGSIGFNVHNTNAQADFAIAGQGSSASWDVGVLDSDADQFSIGYETGGSYLDGSSKVFTITTGGNVGLGTTFPLGGLSVMNGNVGIGTWKPGGSLVVQSGNVAIGQSSAGYMLEVAGDEYVHGNNYVYPGSYLGTTNFGVGMSFPSGIEFTIGGTSLGSNTADFSAGGVGIGTSLQKAGLAIMNGNVGIGTWIIDSGGLVITSTVGNVGIGTIRPGKALDVSGTVRADYFIGNGAGLTGITASNWTASGSDVYQNSGNVGIGTSATTTSALTVMNGNVGIGTWKPNNLFQVGNIQGSGGNANYIFSVNTAQNVSMAGSNIYLGTDGVSTSLIGLNGNSGGGILVYGGNHATSSLNLISSHTNGTTDAIKFFVGNTGGTEAMRIQDNSGTANIGIGTTKPDAAFQVGVNSSSAKGFLVDSNGNVGLGTSITSNASISVMTGNVGIGTWKPRGALEVNNNFVYNGMYDNGNSSTSLTIDWNKGNIQKVTMTGNCTFTFTAPGSIARLALKLVQDATGSRTATWPATVKWPGGTAPTLTTTASTGTDLVSCLYDGTNYLCSTALDLR